MEFDSVEQKQRFERLLLRVRPRGKVYKKLHLDMSEVSQSIMEVQAGVVRIKEGSE